MSNLDDEMQAEYDFSQARRGPIVPSGSHKERITIRIDADILHWFRDYVNSRGGGSYQAMMNQALREYIEDQSKEWETLLRRVVREELQAASVREPAHESVVDVSPSLSSV
ncbi:conserved protein of unknown function [Candidatus Promineifilum breve]|uniref:CopG family transcriptional regulator n=1 Tax=Candidatus Promineifilum breve TaxID=1806508 RepID=A0A170PJT0_9CHLR|nr:BrnA antitoxin family protein [Candidatus Promineifilum breve]CUS05927.1 conserved protein of unknown function [Candidatus Promineifilum breve]